MRRSAAKVKPANVVGVREAGLTKERGPLRRFWKVLGPGIIVGASDDDPSGIATYSVAGFLAIPILIGSSAYAMSEVFWWRYGLSKHPGRAPQFYIIILLAMVVGIELNLVGISPIAALFWTAAINGFLAPVLLIVIMLIANNRKIMGDPFVAALDSSSITQSSLFCPTRRLG
jgi:Mn2+/Fe2+ NRAMP family transporter